VLRIWAGGIRSLTRYVASWLPQKQMATCRREPGWIWQLRLHDPLVQQDGGNARVLSRPHAVSHRDGACELGQLSRGGFAVATGAARTVVRLRRRAVDLRDRQRFSSRFGSRRRQSMPAMRNWPPKACPFSGGRPICPTGATARCSCAIPKGNIIEIYAEY
jgi:hypothetical protein